jgi:uncharacterized membrane-anchored protein YhcB (DUF1043 family)
VVTVVALVGVLAGILMGAVASARYLRQEIAANVGPRLGKIESQLELTERQLSVTERQLMNIQDTLDEHRRRGS